MFLPYQALPARATGPRLPLKPTVPRTVTRSLLEFCAAITFGPLVSTCCQWPESHTSNILPNFRVPRASKAGRPEETPSFRVSCGTVLAQPDFWIDQANSNLRSSPKVCQPQKPG